MFLFTQYVLYDINLPGQSSLLHNPLHLPECCCWIQAIWIMFLSVQPGWEVVTQLLILDNFSRDMHTYCTHLWCFYSFFLHILSAAFWCSAASSGLRQEVCCLRWPPQRLPGASFRTVAWVCYAERWAKLDLLLASCWSKYSHMPSQIKHWSIVHEVLWTLTLLYCLKLSHLKF